MTQALIELGLSSYEAAAYLALLRKNGSTPTEIATKAKIPRQRIYDVLASLTARGFCYSQDTNPKTYFAVDPAIALTRLREQKAEEFRRESERHSERSDTLIGKLLPIYKQGTEHGQNLPFLELINDRSAMAARSVELARSAKKSVTFCIKSPFTLPTEVNTEFIEAALHKKLKCFAIFEDGALEEEIPRQWAAHFLEAGHEVRTSQQVPVKLNIFDEKIALLTMRDQEAGPPTFTSLVINHPETVQFFYLGFQTLWDLAKPLKRLKK